MTLEVDLSSALSGRHLLKSIIISLLLKFLISHLVLSLSHLKKKKNFSDFHECAHSIFSLIISYIRTYLVLADHTLGESLNLAYCPSCGFKTWMEEELFSSPRIEGQCSQWWERECGWLSHGEKEGKSSRLRLIGKIISLLCPSTDTVDSWCS